MWEGKWFSLTVESSAFTIHTTADVDPFTKKLYSSTPTAWNEQDMVSSTAAC
jgi:hypothetical protein